MPSPFNGVSTTLSINKSVQRPFGDAPNPARMLLRDVRKSATRNAFDRNRTDQNTDGILHAVSAVQGIAV